MITTQIDKRTVRHNENDKVLNDLVIRRYASGKRYSRAKFREGDPEGEYVFWYESGQVMSRYFYQMGFIADDGLSILFI